MSIEVAWLLGQMAIAEAVGCSDPSHDHEPPLTTKFREAMLAAHVDACEEFIYKASVAEYTSSQPMSAKQRCGDGWFCDKAEEIRQLGQQGGCRNMADRKLYCPRCGRASLEVVPVTLRVYCLYTADCGYSS